MSLVSNEFLAAQYIDATNNKLIVFKRLFYYLVTKISLYEQINHR